MKKKIFNRDGPFLKFASFVFISSLLLSLFVVFPSAESNERAVINPPETMLNLPKGSYLFDDYLEAPDVFDTTLTVGVSFAFTTFIDGSGQVFNGDGLSFVFDNWEGFVLSYNLNNGLGTSTPTSFEVYNDGDFWIDNRVYAPPGLKPCFQEIFIVEDVSVPSWFYDWIMNNSTYNASGELVKISAGAYRASKIIGEWPDDISPDYYHINYSFYLPFTVYNEDDGITYTYNCMWLQYLNPENDGALHLISYENTSASLSGDWEYNNSSGISSSGKWIKDYYRFITVTRDFYVSRETYNLFTSIYVNITDYQAGYEEGYNKGYSDGLSRNDAYQDGYEAGFKDGETGYSGVFAPFVSGIIGALDSWNFFGTFSLWDFIVSALTLMGMVWLLKLVAGG